MRTGVMWLARLAAVGMLLVSTLSVPAVVARDAAVPAAPLQTVLTGSVDGGICLTPRFSASASDSCAACFECVNREGQSDRCLALCERLQCDPGAGNPRCEVVGLCIEGYYWNANACQCLPDRPGN